MTDVSSTLDRPSLSTSSVSTESSRSRFQRNQLVRQSRSTWAERQDSSPRPSSAPADWRSLLASLFPEHTRYTFGPHHQRFWDWVWAIEAGEKPQPFVGIWPRGGAKSTSAEMACVVLGHRRRRRYGLYVSGTQAKADDHVGTVASMLESKEVQNADPGLGDRAIGKFGSAKGWRHNRLRTASGFTIDAAGLDRDIRGAKLDDARPDFIVLDDVDDARDSPDTISKKLRAITRDILPAGSEDCAVVAIQNLVSETGVFAQLAKDPPSFLTNRILSGPLPALDGATAQLIDGRWTLLAGEPTWVGQDMARCQEQIEEWGYLAWLAEAQHEVGHLEGSLFRDVAFRYHKVECDHRCTKHPLIGAQHRMATCGEKHSCDARPLPDFVRACVWVDPAVTSTDGSDSQGVICDAIAESGVIYRLGAWEGRESPLNALRRAILLAREHGATTVGVETNQGGDTWQSVYREALASLGITPSRGPRFRQAKANSGDGPKVERAARMLADYERGRIVHVIGAHETLEKALRRFPVAKPYDLVDASYWSWMDLRQGIGDPHDVFGDVLPTMAENESDAGPLDPWARVAWRRRMLEEDE